MCSCTERTIVLFLLFLSIAVSSRADEFASALSEKGHIFWQQTTLSNKLLESSAADLVQKIEQASNEPCSIDFCRTVLKDHPSKLAVEVAMDMAIELEENGKPFAIVTRPVKAEKYSTWIDYLSGKSGSHGSRDFQTALLLRRQARIIKFNIYLKQRVGVTYEQLTDEHLIQLKADETFGWLLNDIFEPVTIVLEPELKKKLGVSLSQPGPSFCRYAAVNLLAGQGELGCLAESGKLVLRHTDSCLFLGNVKDTLTVEQAIENDSLGDIMGHEIFHSIMFDMMSDKAPGKQRSLSKVGHDAHVTSDYSLALSEGWAELFEAWSGIDNDAFDNRGGSSTVTRFILGRQSPIRRNKYVQADFEKFRNTKKRGKIKTGSQMVATEGLVAGLLYVVLTHEKIENSFALLLEAMYLHQPQNLCEMFEALINCAQDDETRRILYLTFLHNTKFSTVSAEARSLYQEAFKAKLDYFEGKNNGADESEVSSLEQERQSTKERYYEFIEPIIEQVLAGKLPLDECLGREIWLDLRDEDDRLQARRNLNTISASDLVMFDISGTGAQLIIETRDKLGSITSLDELRGLRQVDKERLQSLIEEFEATQG